MFSFSDLFSSEKDFASYLINYCYTVLEKDQVGYSYSDPEERISVEIELKDLKVFTISKNGLTITFQPYHVGGWADGPYSVSIPFEKIAHLVIGTGPLATFIE